MEAKMTTLREAAQKALIELEQIADEVFSAYGNSLGDAILALRAALAQEDAQPVAWMYTDVNNRRIRFLEWIENVHGYRGDWIKTPLYAAPPAREPLTEDEHKVQSLQWDVVMPPEVAQWLSANPPKFVTSDKTQYTHAEMCWSWGPKHYECALREIGRLRKELNK